jgi:hypothetical protein
MHMRNCLLVYGPGCNAENSCCRLPADSSWRDQRDFRDTSRNVKTSNYLACVFRFVEVHKVASLHRLEGHCCGCLGAEAFPFAFQCQSPMVKLRLHLSAVLHVQAKTANV